jgi:hypothetical protein
MISAPHRRLYARKILRRPATVLLPGGTVRDVTTWDLGQDGLSVLSSKPISPGSKCQVSFELVALDKTTSVTAPVKVVYCSFSGLSGFKVGMNFGPLDADSASAIEAFSR